MPKITHPITECPSCGGALWDNRGKKKTAKSPDFKCKNKSCSEAYWLPEETRAATRVANGSGPKWTWPQLSKMYERSLVIAQKHVTGMAAANKLTVTTADVLAGAATVFIAATRDGVKPLAPKAPPPPPLEPEPEPDFEEDDSGLPF